MFFSTLLPAAVSGLASAGLVSFLSLRPAKKLSRQLEAVGKELVIVRNSAHTLGQRIDTLDKVPGQLIEKRIVPMEEAINALTSKLEQVPSRSEVAEAFKRAAEIDAARRAEEARVSQAAQLEAFKNYAEAAQNEARLESQLEDQQRAMQHWAAEQRVLIRREVEQELAAEMERRQQESIARNPLNARPASAGLVAQPAGYEEVARRRFARPGLAPIPEPWEQEISED